MPIGSLNRNDDSTLATNGDVRPGGGDVLAFVAGGADGELLCGRLAVGAGALAVLGMAFEAVVADESAVTAAKVIVPVTVAVNVGVLGAMVVAFEFAAAVTAALLFVVAERGGGEVGVMSCVLLSARTAAAAAVMVVLVFFGSHACLERKGSGCWWWW